MDALSLSDRLFAELVLAALAAERQLRPFVGELGADPMLFRSFGAFGRGGRWQEVPHPSRFVRERSEEGDRVGELYTRMVESDANIAALWEKRVKAVLALPRTIRAADASPLAEETALFVHTALSIIPLRVMAISNTLEGVLKGVAINEILWERRTRGPLAGAWLPADVIDRPMWRFGWSAKDKALHVVTNPGRLEPVVAPPMKFQVLSYGTKDNPWGRALLDRLYWVWYLKRHASKYWAVFVERFAQPLIKGTYPFKQDQDVANKEQEDRMLAILGSIRTGSSIALPSGLDISFLEASRGGDASYFSFVSWLERAEALLLLGEVDTSGLARGAGSFAKALISNEVRLETVQHDAHLLGSFETDTLVRWLVLLNFGPDAPIPKSVYDATDAADRSQRMRGINYALNDGVPVPLGYYRMTMRVPVPVEGEPVVERPEPPVPLPPPVPGDLPALWSGEGRVALTPRPPLPHALPPPGRGGERNLEMKPVGRIVNGSVLWTPAVDQVLELAAPAAGSPALEFPALVPVDLTESHGIVITPQRLGEMVDAYDPGVEMASLNLDHNWGGPSLGWCERVWLQDGALWVRYVDLDPEAVELVRSKRYTRRSAEIALSHPVTGGWYLTGCALLGNARPAIPGLPPVTLCRPQYVLTSRKETLVPESDPPALPDSPSPSTGPTTGETELAALRAQVAEGAQALSTLLRQRAELDVDRRLTQLGARVTPAMAKLARPLLVELLAERTPATVKLQADPAKPAAEVSIAEQVFQILAAFPAVEALAAGRMAEADPAARLTAGAGALSSEREAELEQKYRFSSSWGFRAN